MKRKKVIEGSSRNLDVAITMEIDCNGTLSRDESQRAMDAMAGYIMKMFESDKVPYVSIPLVRLKVQ